MLKLNNKYEILTPDGFKDFRGVQKLQKKTLLFTCGNGVSCKVSKDHVFRINQDDVLASSLKVGDYLTTSYGISNIISISEGGVCDVYDPIDVDGHVYYGDSIAHHNCSFLGSDSTLIDETTLKALLAQDRVDPIDTNNDGTLRVYEKPLIQYEYVMGVDVAKGTGEHYSTVQIFKIISNKPIKLEQVCVYENNKIDVYSFAAVVNKLSLFYNNAYIMCENNSEGAAIVSQLWWEYENENLVCEGTKTTALGIRATKKTKPIANLLMKKLVEDGMIKIVDYRTIQQFLIFLDMGNNRFGGNGQDDDLISAFYWACYFFEFDLLEESSEVKRDDDDDEGWDIFTNYDEEMNDYEVLVR